MDVCVAFAGEGSDMDDEGGEMEEGEDEDGEGEEGESDEDEQDSDDIEANMTELERRTKDLDRFK